METRLREGLRVRVRIDGHEYTGEVRNPRVDGQRYVFDLKTHDSHFKKLLPIQIYEVLDDPPPKRAKVKKRARR